MGVLAANKSRAFRKAGSQRFKVGNSQTIYKGASIALRDDGLVYEWAGTSGERFLGFASNKVVTDSSGDVTREGVPAGFDNTGISGYVIVLKPDSLVTDVTVTGVDDQNDTGKPVWMTDDNTFTLIPQANVMPIGYVIVVTSTGDNKADVAIYNFDQMTAALMTDHGWQEQLLMPSVENTIITGTMAAILALKPAIGSGLITKLIIIAGTAMVGSSDTNFKLKLGSTFLKNTAGTFKFSVSSAQLNLGLVHTINIADSTTNSAAFGPGDAVSLWASEKGAASAGSMSAVLHSARRLAG